MPIVNTASWNSDFERRKSIRDAARKAFYNKIGIQPVRDISKIQISPQSQLEKVNTLFSKSNSQQSDASVDEAVARIKSAISLSGLAAGGPMATVGKTLFSNAKSTPNALLRTHFNAIVEGDDE